MDNLIKTGLFFIFILFSPFVVSNESGSNNPFSWDLSYVTVFLENDVPKNDTMLKYFNDAYHSKGKSREMHLPDGLFADIDMAKIKTAILIDYQVYWYMGHRSSTLYLDDGQSVVARTYDSKSNKVKYYKVNSASFADFSAVIIYRSQSLPFGAYTFKVAKGYSYAGYIGVISRYSIDGSSQQLITNEDFLKKQMEVGELGQFINSMQKKMKLTDVKN